MAYVTDDEAERIAGYRQQQGLASKPAPAPAPDPFANFQDTVDFAPPAVYGPFQPSAPAPSYSLTGPSFDSFNVGNQMGPFELYDLGFEQRGQQSPVLFQPEPEPFYDPRGAAFQASQRSQSNPFLEDFGASLQETGNLFADRTQRLPGLVEGLGGMFGFGGRAGGLPETEQLGEIYQKDILPNVSGNEFIRSFTPYEPENLPGPLPYLTDALAPINFATAGIASEVPVLGAMFKGPYLANLGAEMGIDIGARFGAEQAAGERGASVPLFGEQPAWLRGLEGGLIGGLGAAGAIKGADAGIANAPAIGRSLAETNPFAANMPGYPRGVVGAIDPETGRPFQWQAVGGGALDFDEEVSRLTRTINDNWGTPVAARAQKQLDNLILSDKGKPVVLFHGSDEPNLDVISSKGRTATGAFFAPDEDVAGYYGRNTYAVHVTDSGMLDLRGEQSFASFARNALGLEGDELADAVRWHDEGTLYNSYGGRGLQDDVVNTAKSLGFRGVIFNDATSQFGVNPSYVFVDDVPVGAGLRGGADITPQPPKLTADAGPVMDARRTLLDALQQEATIRRTGTAAAEISAGRAKQAAGIGSAIEGLQPNATIDEALQAARGGATAGPLRQTFAAPLELAPEVQSQLVREIIEGSAGKQFDTLRALKALDKLQAGEGLQPNEIKLLRTIYGDEVADSIVRVNRGRIITTPELTDADLAEIGRRAVVDGRRVARLEVTAQRQLEIADNLQRQSYMDPTNTRLQKAAEEARARGIAQQNEAERLMIDRASRVEAGQQAKAFKAEQAEAGKGSRAEARTNEAYDLKYPNSEMVIQRAEKMLGEIPYQSSALRQDHIEAIRLWLKQTEMHLDAVGDDAPGLVRSLYAGATGEVSDSFTAALIDQRAVLRSTLEAQGLPDTMAKTIAKLLQDAELRARYGENVPQHVLDALEEAKSLPYGSEGAIGGLASISQELKNTQFGIGDLAVFGQQGLKVGTTNAVQFLVGSVNRLLHMAHLPSMDTTLADVTLPKRIVYQLDGVAQSSKGVTDLTNEGTILRHLGKGGQFLDEKALVPATRALTDFQFKTVLTNIRNVVYEGNLILARASGADISDPLVRSKAAAWANAATGAGKLAQDTKRAQLEKAFLLSPAMRRAQAQQVGQVARGLTGGTRVDRVLAAATITSTAGALLGVGKLLNDYVGLEEFEFDPSKPGFGNITLPGGTVVNLFPQEQFVKAIARSIGVLAREGFGEAEAKDIAKEWAKFLVSSASPAVRPILASTGVGYDPGRGWRFGDLGEGKGLAERALDAAPLPPIVSSIARGGVDAVRTPLEALGVNAYKEGAYSERDRALTADTEFGKPYRDLEPWQKLAAEEKYGRVYSNDPKIAASQQQADTLQEEQRAKQEANDGRLLRGEITPQQWRDERSRDDAYFAGRFDQLYAGVNFADKSLSPVDLYYKAIADATDRTTGDVDWDKVDAWKAAQGPEALAYIERNTNLRDTNLEQQYRQDVRLLGDSGYFDAENKVAVRKADPEIAAAVRRWGYSEMSVKAEDTVMRYTAQQEVDDRSLAQGAITPEQWRENYNTRRDQLRAEKDGIYAGMKDDGVSTDPIDAYFKEIEKAVAPNGQDIDWQQVDAWVAQQPADVQAAINSYASPGLTPVVDQYRADVKKIVESQYWDVSDRVTQYWAKANGFDWTEGTDADKFWGDIQQEVYQRVQAKGFAPLEARSLTNVVMGQLQKDYVDVSSKVRSALRDSNPELARLLVQWGFWEPGKEDTGELIAAGTLR